MPVYHPKDVVLHTLQISLIIVIFMVMPHIRAQHLEFYGSVLGDLGLVEMVGKSVFNEATTITMFHRARGYGPLKSKQEFVCVSKCAVRHVPFSGMGGPYLHGRGQQDPGRLLRASLPRRGVGLSGMWDVAIHQHDEGLLCS